jgi:hypothetical protein
MESKEAVFKRLLEKPDNQVRYTTILLDMWHVVACMWLN